MKFATIAALATTAAAGVTVRDASIVLGVLSDVSDSIGSVDSAAKAYTGGVPTDALNAAKDLVAALVSGKSKVDGSGNLDINDAVKLQPPVQELTAKGKALESDLVAKRSQVEKAGQCSQVEAAVKQVASDGQALVNAVVGKVEANVKPIASSLAAPLASILAQAVDDFSPASCKDAAGGGSGGSSSSSAAPTTSSSAAAATTTKEAPTTKETGYPVPSTSSSSEVVAPTTTPYTVPTTTGSGPVTTPTVVPAGASLLAPAGVLALALAVFAL